MVLAKLCANSAASVIRNKLGFIRATRNHECCEGCNYNQYEPLIFGFAKHFSVSADWPELNLRTFDLLRHLVISSIILKTLQR